MNAKRITFDDLYMQVATTHRIHPVEAIDEVCDAFQACYGREPRESITAAEGEVISEYIAEQYRTKRTRTAYWDMDASGRWGRTQA